MKAGRQIRFFGGILQTAPTAKSKLIVMASKESSRSAAFLALLQQRREAPKKVWEVTPAELPTTKVVNAELQARLRSVDQTKHYFPPLLNTFSICGKTILPVDAVRFNRWGKFEVRFSDLVSNFKALKASPEEIESLSWIQFNSEDEEIRNFLAACVTKTVDHGGKLPAPGFAIRLLDISFGKNTGLGAEKRDPVFGKVQVVVFPNTGKESGSSSPSSSAASGAVEPPAAKKPRKSPKESKKEKEKEKEKEPVIEPVRDDDIPPEDVDSIVR